MTAVRLRPANDSAGVARRRVARGGAVLVVGTIVGLVLSSQAVADPPAGSDSRDRSASTSVIWWNDAAGRAALAACIAPSDNPLHESRLYAMMHIAIGDALNAISRKSQQYSAKFRAERDSSPDAAVAAAAHDVMASEIPKIPFPAECVAAGVASVEADYAVALATIPEGPAKQHGIAAGQQAAASIVAARSSDGSDTPLQVTDYPQGTAPGDWRFTPDRPFAFAPGWADVDPFALRRATQFDVRPPLDLTSSRYAKDLNEIKALGGDGITTPSARTPEQTEIALFWLESSPLAWNRVARTLATTAHLDLWEQARLFGLLNIAMADGYIASWQTKYTQNFWRPVTAVREADNDGNSATAGDPTWTPLVTTPPIPDYDSAHSVEGAAAAAVFVAFFHTDRFDFTACSRTLPAGATCTDTNPTLRSYARFSDAARENAVSRIYIGFHFRDATEQGLIHGAAVGLWTAFTVMRPVR